MIDTCIQMEAYKNALTQATNNNGLTIGATYYILKDLTSYIQVLYNQSLITELRNQDTLEQTKEVTVDLEGNKVKEGAENEQQTFASID